MLSESIQNSADHNLRYSISVLKYYSVVNVMAADRWRARNATCVPPFYFTQNRH